MQTSQPFSRKSCRRVLNASLMARTPASAPPMVWWPCGGALTNEAGLWLMAPFMKLETASSASVIISIGSGHSVDILNSPSQACIHRCDKRMSDWTGATPFIPVVKSTMIRYLKDSLFALSKFKKKKSHAISLLNTDFFFLLWWVVDLAAWQERQSAWNGKWPWRRCCSSLDLFKSRFRNTAGCSEDSSEGMDANPVFVSTIILGS